MSRSHLLPSGITLLSVCTFAMGQGVTGIAQAKGAMPSPSAFIQLERAKDRVSPSRIRLFHPRFHMVSESGANHLLADGRFDTIQDSGGGNYTSTRSERVPAPPSDGERSFLLWSRALGLRFLDPSGFYTHASAGWKRTSLVPAEFDWTLTWGSVEALADGGILMVTGSSHQFERVDPVTWNAVKTWDYPSGRSGQPGEPALYREPMSVRVDNKVLVFYPFTPKGDVFLWDGDANQVFRIIPPWEATANTVLATSSGKQVSNMPATGQWFPSGAHQVYFLGANGDRWFSYRLDLRTHTWTAWEAHHQGWDVPYGIPRGDLGLMNVEDFK